MFSRKKVIKSQSQQICNSNQGNEKAWQISVFPILANISVSLPLKSPRKRPLISFSLRLFMLASPRAARQNKSFPSPRQESVIKGGSSRAPEQFPDPKGSQGIARPEAPAPAGLQCPRFSTGRQHRGRARLGSRIPGKREWRRRESEHPAVTPPSDCALRGFIRERWHKSDIKVSFSSISIPAYFSHSVFKLYSLPNFYQNYFHPRPHLSVIQSFTIGLWTK